MLFVVFVISIAILLFAILKLKLNPFIALLLAAIATAFMVLMPLGTITGKIVTGFGNTMKGIGIVIGLGIILGKILAEAYATDQIADSMVRTVGEKHASLATTLTGYLVSIPVFFDAAFVILTPLNHQLSRTTKTPYITMLTGLAIGLIATHATVIPTPGPLAVAGNMNADIGMFTLYAILVSLPGALVGGWLYGKFLGKRNPAISEPIHDEGQAPGTAASKPPVSLALFVLLLPILLILIGSIMALVVEKDSTAASIFGFFGDKNIALLIGVIVAMITMKPYINKPVSELITVAAESAGLILLITGAGGAFGTIINDSGIGKYIVDTLKSWNVSPLLLGFVLSQILRSAQGSTTVALITTSAILGPVAATMGVSPVLVGLAICAGGIGLSLPNDSGFWVVSRYGGISEADTIRSWTIGGTICGVTAFLAVLVLSMFSEALPGLH
jgi:GntP family gluconate:H+ symporter